MKFHEGPSCVSLALPYGNMKGRTDVKRVVAFCNCYTKAPENTDCPYASSPPPRPIFWLLLTWILRILSLFFSCCGISRFIFKHTIPPWVVSVCDVIYVSNMFYFVPPICVLVCTMALFQRHFETSRFGTLFLALIISAVQSVNLLVTWRSLHHLNDSHFVWLTARGVTYGCRYLTQMNIK
jgi:hypothetical protein